MVRRGRLLLLCAATTAFLLNVPVAAGGQNLRATANGEAISLREAGGMSCHDLAFPVLTCYPTSAEMLDAVDSWLKDSRAAAAATIGYVVVFEHGAYAGAAQTISRDYSYLGDIGWNDKVSSLKSYGASGRFWEHAPNGGLIYYVYATSRSPYVGDLYNDKFSAVDLN